MHDYLLINDAGRHRGSAVRADMPCVAHAGDAGSLGLSVRRSTSILHSSVVVSAHKHHTCAAAAAAAAAVLVCCR
jgi:hypothetical protein